MRINVPAGLRTVKVAEYDVHVDALAYGGIALEAELLVPQLCLADQDEAHGTFGVELVVEHEPELFQCLLIQKVGFVQDTDDLFMLDSADDLQLPLQLAFCISPVEAGLKTKLIKEAGIEPTGCKLGVCQVEHYVVFPGQCSLKRTDQGGFPASGVSCDHDEEVVVHPVDEPALRLLNKRGNVQVCHRDVLDKWCVCHFKEGFIHDSFPPSSGNSRRRSHQQPSCFLLYSAFQVRQGTGTFQGPHPS